MTICFPQQGLLVRNMNAELDLSNYATKEDLKTQQMFIH